MRGSLARHAWWVPFGYGALMLAAAIHWLVTEAPFDRGTWERVR